MDLPGDFTGACWRPSFYIGAPYPGSWWAGQRTREFRHMVEAAGMKLVEEPPRPQAPQ